MSEFASVSTYYGQSVSYYFSVYRLDDDNFVKYPAAAVVSILGVI